MKLLGHFFLLILTAIVLAFSVSACGDDDDDDVVVDDGDSYVDNIDLSKEYLYSGYTLFDGFDDLPDDIIIERGDVESFTRPEGDTHYYEAVRVTSENVTWLQAAILAEDTGGYLATITSEEENEFVFSLVDAVEFYWRFPDDYNPDSHNGIRIGPFLGGYRPTVSEDPTDDWRWITGEQWSYTNWTDTSYEDEGTETDIYNQQLMDEGFDEVEQEILNFLGIDTFELDTQVPYDMDSRDNTQPNGNTSDRIQAVMGLGELNLPVPSWGDYFADVANYDQTGTGEGTVDETGWPIQGPEEMNGRNRGFVIEYDSNPKE